MDLGLTDRTVLVTGASGDIGREVARAFAAEGARVALGYAHHRETAARLVAELGAERAVAVRYDLTDPGSVASALSVVERRFGPVEVYVAAGIAPPAWPVQSTAFEEVPVDDWVPFLRGNVEQTLRTVQLVLPGMRRHGWGRITFVSTHLVRQGRPGRGFYTAAKAALHGLSRSLAWDAGGDGVLVNVVCPGLTVAGRAGAVPETVLSEEAGRTPSGRLSRPADIARAVVFVSSAANGNITGEVLTVAGGR